MAHLKLNSFVSYSLTPQEEEAGQVFNANQKMVLQNKLALIAEEKIRITFDPLNPSAFLQREAELQGELNIISWLLTTSDEVEEILASRQQNPEATQP